MEVIYGHQLMEKVSKKRFVMVGKCMGRAERAEGEE